MAHLRVELDLLLRLLRGKNKREQGFLPAGVLTSVSYANVPLVLISRK
jgi:hypothetical protein